MEVGGDQPQSSEGKDPSIASIPDFWKPVNPGKAAVPEPLTGAEKFWYTFPEKCVILITHIWLSRLITGVCFDGIYPGNAEIPHHLT